MGEKDKRAIPSCSEKCFLIAALKKHKTPILGPCNQEIAQMYTSPRPPSSCGIYLCHCHLRSIFDCQQLIGAVSHYAIVPWAVATVVNGGCQARG